MLSNPNTNFFYGVVEDIDDPLYLGRVRVRAYGIHSDNKSLIPTAKLPWCTPINNNTASFKGIGASGCGYVVDSFVMGMFTDEDLQTAVVLGSMSTLNPLDGNKSDLHPLSYANQHAIIDNKNSVLSSSIKGTSGSSWNEYSSIGSSVYPANSVVSAVSGHVFEIDSTESHERIHLYHTIGSFFEFHDNGSYSISVRDSRYNTIDKSDHYNIGSDLTYTVSGLYDLMVDGVINIKGSILNVMNDVMIEGNNTVTGVSTSGSIVTGMVTASGTVSAPTVVCALITAAAGSLGGVDPKAILASGGKAPTELDSSSMGDNDLTKDRLAMKDMSADSIVDTNGSWFTKSNATPHVMTESIDNISTQALLNVPIINTIVGGELSMYGATGVIDIAKAGDVSDSVLKYDVTGKEFKIIPINSGNGGNGGNLDGGTF